MARVFTIEFTYNHQLYKSVIILKDGNRQLNMRVKVFDVELINILGNDSIEFEGLSGYHHLSFANSKAICLLEVIHEAVLDHLTN